MRYYAPFPGGGYPVGPRGPHALRIGDAERDSAAADLGEHFAAGRLTLDELNERLDEVFASRTLGQLNHVLADLPGSARVAGRRTPGSPGWPELAVYSGWDPATLRYHQHLAAEGLWRAGPDPFYLQARERQTPTATDRAGRLAALSLLLIAMLIWLFTALLFAHHGLDQPVGPGVPVSGHGYQYQYQPGFGYQSGGLYLPGNR